MNGRRASLRGLVVAALTVCGLLLGLVGQASAMYVGLERRSAITLETTADKSVTVTCPAGKKALSAGFDITPGNGHVLITQMRPNATLTSITARGVNDETGTPSPWYVGAYTVCGHEPAGLERVYATSPSNSVAKGVTATCPAGKRVIGTGAEIVNSNRQVLLEKVLPNAALTSVTAHAVEDETGNSGNWSVTAFAVCSSSTAGLERVPLTTGLDSSAPKVIESPCSLGNGLVGMGGEISSANGQVVMDALFPNLAVDGAGLAAFEDDTGNSAAWSITAYAICAATAERVAVTSPRGSPFTASVTVSCPNAKLAAGGGMEITSGFGGVDLDTLGPQNAPPNAWTAVASEEGTVGNWTVTAYAICTTPRTAQQQVGVASSFDGTNPKTLDVSCPAGTSVLGVGAETAGSNLTITTLRPNSGLTTATVSAAKKNPADNAPWGLSGRVVCASPPLGLQRVFAQAAPDSEETKSVTATCPAGKHLLGLGGNTTGVGGEVILDDLRPDAALTNAKVTGFEFSTSPPDTDWGLTAYAICATR